SLHPDLLQPLARLIAKASKQSQIIVVSHAASLVQALRDAGARQIVLTKQLGETVVADEESPIWNWPSRGADTLTAEISGQGAAGLADNATGATGRRAASGAMRIESRLTSGIGRGGCLRARGGGAVLY